MALTQVKTAGLADDAITSAKIADDAVITAAIADDAVTGANIADDTVAEANMANDAIGLAEIKAGTDGQILTFDASGNPSFVGPGSDGQVLTSTGAGSPPAFEAIPAAGISDVVSDTSPQLGGDLDTNSFEISLDDSHKVKFGASDDLTIEHNDTDALLKNDKGEFKILSDTFRVRSNDNSETLIRALKDGAVELYYNDVKKIETTSAGATVTGGLTLTGGLSMQANQYMHGSSGIDFYGDGSDAASKLVQIVDGNVKLKDGHGIDFSATGDGNATDTSELLDDYEEGTWTPAMDGLSNTPTYHNLVGKYVKVGSIVKCQGFIQINASPTFTNTSHVFTVSGLPYTASGSGYLRVIGNCAWQGIDWVGASQSTYGHDDDTIIQAAIDDTGNKTRFRTMGQADYYMGELKNIVFHDNGWILEWDFTYMTI